MNSVCRTFLRARMWNLVVLFLLVAGTAPLTSYAHTFWPTDISQMPACGHAMDEDMVEVSTYSDLYNAIQEANDIKYAESWSQMRGPRVIRIRESLIIADPSSPLPPIGPNIILWGDNATIDFQGGPGLRIEGNGSAIMGSNTDKWLTLRNFSGYGITASCVWGTSVVNTRIFCQSGSSGIRFANTSFSRIQFNQIVPGTQNCYPSEGLEYLNPISLGIADNKEAKAAARAGHTPGKLIKSPGRLELSSDKTAKAALRKIVQTPKPLNTVYKDKDGGGGGEVPMPDPDLDNCSGWAGIEVVSEGLPCPNADVYPCVDYPCVGSDNGDAWQNLLDGKICPEWLDYFKNFDQYKVNVSFNQVGTTYQGNAPFTPSFNIGISIRGTTAAVRTNQIAVSREAGLSVRACTRAIIENNYVGLEFTSERVATPYSKLTTGESRLFATGIQGGCDNGDIQFLNNKITNFGEGMRLTQGPCGNTPSGPRSDDSNDPATLLTTNYSLVGNRFGAQMIKLSEGTTGTSLNLIGLVNEGRGMGEDCMAALIDAPENEFAASARLHVLTDDKASVAINGSTFAAGARFLEYDCPPEGSINTLTGECLQPPTLSVQILSDASFPDARNYRITVTGRSGALINLYGLTDSTLGYGSWVLRRSFTLPTVYLPAVTSTLTFDITLASHWLRIGATQQVPVLGTSQLSEDQDGPGVSASLGCGFGWGGPYGPGWPGGPGWPSGPGGPGGSGGTGIGTLCYGIETYDPAPALTLLDDAAHSFVPAVPAGIANPDGYTEYNFNPCSFDAVQALAVLAPPPAGTRIDWFLGDAPPAGTPASTVTGPNYGTSTLPWSLLTAPAGNDPGVRWAVISPAAGANRTFCRKVIKISVHPVPLVLLGDTVFPTTCGPIPNGGFSVAAEGSFSVSVFADEAGTMPLSFALTTIVSPTVPSITVKRVRTMPAGTYWLRISTSSSCIALINRKIVIETATPRLVMNCNPVLPCRAGKFDSVAIPFHIVWPGLSQVTGSGSPYTQIQYQVRIMDSMRILPSWVKRGHLMAEGATGIIMVPYLSVHPQRPYSILVEAMGDVCPDGCGEFEPICQAATYITFERLALSVRPKSGLEQADGFYQFPYCPNTAEMTSGQIQEQQSVNLQVSWRRSTCTAGIGAQGIRLTTKPLDARGGIIGSSSQVALPLSSATTPSTLAFSSLITAQAIPKPGPDGIQRRYVVEGMGCADSIDVRALTVDTSFRVIPKALDCHQPPGVLPVALVETTIGAGAFSLYRWDTLSPTPADLGLEGPTVNLMQGAYRAQAQIQTTVGSCPTRKQSFSILPPSLPVLTIDYQTRYNGQPNCGIRARYEAVASGIPADQRARRYEVVWTAQNKGGIARQFSNPTYTAPTPDLAQGWIRYQTQPVLPWDTLIVPPNTAFLATRDKMRLNAVLEDPIDSSRYRAFLVDAESGCMTRSEPFSYIKPDAARKFTLVIGWGPDRQIPFRDTLPASGGLGPAMVATLLRQQAQCLSSSEALAAQLADLTALKTQGLRDTLAVGYTLQSSVATLMVYDRAGRLAATVPPNGVVDLVRSQTFDHNLRSRYTYSSLGFRLSEETPDLGRSIFWPDRVGRVRFSQTAQDRAEGSTPTNNAYGAFRYSMYDRRGRIIETGRVAANQTVSGTLGLTAALGSINDQSLWTPGAWTRSEYITTRYDQGTESWQTFLRSRVASQTRYQPDGRGATAEVSSIYSYDPHGAVRRLEQVINQGSREERHDVRYRYDLISGRVRELWADSATPELAYGQRYHYDSDGRLLLVEGGRSPLYWEPQARYVYYPHGPVRRVELGSERVQGMDYLYTVQGWLKAINSGITLDAGQDPGQDGLTESSFAPDIFSHRLDYFDKDFSLRLPDEISMTTAQESNLAGYFGRKPLFDGNISAQSSAITGSLSLSQTYDYDALARLRAAQDISVTSAGPLSSLYSYDKAGNLKTLSRMNSSGTTIDQLTYTYALDAGSNPTNRLDKVTDAATATGTGSGLASGDHNFGYDAEGRLTHRTDERQNLTWTMDSKIASVSQLSATGTPQRRTRWLYDATGNQIARYASPLNSSGNPTGEDTAAYTLREGQGRELLRFNRYPVGPITPGGDDSRTTPGSGSASTTSTGGPIASTVLDEAIVYGSTMLALAEGPGEAETDTARRLAGRMRYLLQDHLGNIRAEVADQKDADLVTGSQISLTARILSGKNYYPFGMAIQETSTAGSRYGYNGKPQDSRLGGVGREGSYDYGFRAYDASLARFFAVDPLREKYPELTPYQFASNTPIQAIDLDGKESDFSPYMGILWKSAGINTVTEQEIVSKTQAGFEKTGKVASDILTIGGGAVAITAACVGTGGTAIVPIVFGAFAVAGGGAKLVYDTKGEYETSDQIPTTASGLVYVTYTYTYGDKKINAQTLANWEFVDGVLSLKLNKLTQPGKLTEALQKNLSPATAEQALNSIGNQISVTGLVLSFPSVKDSFLKYINPVSAPSSTPLSPVTEPDATSVKAPIVPVNLQPR